MNSSIRSYSKATLASISVVAFIIAVVAHEAVGHGGACLAMGGRITLLTSVYFHCSSFNPLTDAAGPMANLVLGTASWLLAQRWATSSSARLFLALSTAFNLFWGAGYFIFSAVTLTGDWAFVLRDLDLLPLWLGRSLMAALGVFLYVHSGRAIAKLWPANVSFVTPYVAVGVVACCATLFYSGSTAPALKMAAEGSFGAYIGLFILARSKHQRIALPLPSISIKERVSWLVVASISTIAFWLLLGKGFGMAVHA